MFARELFDSEKSSCRRDISDQASLKKKKEKKEKKKFYGSFIWLKKSTTSNLELKITAAITERSPK